MLTASHHYVIISDCEMGEKCRDILGIYRECGAVSQLAGDCYTVRTFSAEEQEKLYGLFAEAMQQDFPAEDAAPETSEETDCLRAQNERLRAALSEALGHAYHFSRMFADCVAVMKTHDEDRCDRLYEMRKILHSSANAPQKEE